MFKEIIMLGAELIRDLHYIYVAPVNFEETDLDDDGKIIPKVERFRDKQSGRRVIRKTYNDI